MQLQNRRALLIGAASGIGHETALAFAQNGARLIIADNNRDAGAQLADTIQGLGVTCRFLAVDVRDETAIKTMVLQAVDFLGGIDSLCNFAGVQYAGTVEEFSSELWDEIFVTNVRSQFLSTKYTIPFLKKESTATIVNMASIAGLRGGSGMTAYSASKGAVIAFTRALANELAPDVRVNSVSPGWIDTPFNTAAIDFMQGPDKLEAFVQHNVPLKRQGTPSEIAPLFVYLSSEESSYITGQTIVIDGGLL